MPTWTPPTTEQLQASGKLAQAVITALANEQGVHAETAVAGAARMAGSYLFTTFGLPTKGMKAGTPVLSETANEHGPLLVNTLEAGLRGLELSIDQSKVPPDAIQTHPPQLNLMETQELLEPAFRPILAVHRLVGTEAAHACALATAILIMQTRGVLNQESGFSLAVFGFVEGTKTAPAAVIPS